MDEGQVLESWKEISAFLGRDVRTCQRWERELDLPIHRLDGSPKARVYAYRDELDRWLDQKLHEREGTPRPTLKKLLVPGLAGLLCVATGLILWHTFVPLKPPPPPAASGQPVLAVLSFENRSGEKSLDYWRGALAELLVADLSQSRYIRVVSCEQMLTALRRLGLDEAEEYSSEDMEKIAAQTRAGHVLRGSFVKAGETIVITAGLQEAGLGQSSGIVKLEARDEYDIIPKVDELSRRIKKELRLTRAQMAYDFEKEAGQAITSSPEALRYYVEGRRHQLNNSWELAIASMERAIEIDPEFAMAFRTLATAHRDLGHIAQARAYMTRALELSARLPDGESQFIEGQLSFWDEDHARTIEILEGLLKTHPGHLNAHTYLGYAYNAVGDIGKAIEHQSFVTRNRNAAVDVRVLAAYFQKKGLYQEAEDLCRSFLQNVEDVLNVRRMLVYCLSYGRKFDLALAEAQKNYLADPRTKEDLGAVLIFEDDLAGAEKLMGPEALFLNRGRFAENVDFSRRDLERSRGNIDEEAAANRRLAMALEKAGRAGAARLALSDYLRLSAESRESAGGSGLPYLPSRKKKDLFVKARIQAEMGSSDEARKTAEELKSLIESGISQKELKFYEYILGLIELNKGDPRGAAEFFEKACGRLDFEGYWSSEQSSFFDGLARALFESGDLDKARETYEKTTLLTTGRREDGDLYARAYYWLGKIAERKGEKERARESYLKFLTLWQNGDPGLPEVVDAKRRLYGN